LLIFTSQSGGESRPIIRVVAGGQLAACLTTIMVVKHSLLYSGLRSLCLWTFSEIPSDSQILGTLTQILPSSSRTASTRRS
jgi:hypothetical protein